MPRGVPGSGPSESTMQLLNRAANDPYSFAMRSIVTGLMKGIANGGRMSEKEFAILQEIERVIFKYDPASLEIKINISGGSENDRLMVSMDT